MTHMKTKRQQSWRKSKTQKRKTKGGGFWPFDGLFGKKETATGPAGEGSADASTEQPVEKKPVEENTEVVEPVKEEVPPAETAPAPAEDPAAVPVSTGGKRRRSSKRGSSKRRRSHKSKR